VPYVDGSPNKGVTQDDDSGYSKRWGNTNAVDKGDLHFYTVSTFHHPLVTVSSSSILHVYAVSTAHTFQHPLVTVSLRSILHCMRHQ
jgi:preprotein translocase subunit Sec63